MTIGLICNRDAVIIRRDESIHQAAKLMREYHVGSVIVVEDTPLGVKPVGVLTDRDLVVEILALQLQPDSVSIGDVREKHTSKRIVRIEPGQVAAIEHLIGTYLFHQVRNEAAHRIGSGQL